MSRLVVIHLSDLHIRGTADKCLKMADQIGAAAFEVARQADACLVAITGDIAFSGIDSQYTAVWDQLLGPLLKSLERETSRPVYVSLIPGNHDCKLEPIDDARETIIEAVVETPSKAESERIVQICTNVQSNFFDFAQRALNPPASKPSALFWQQEIVVEGKSIRISSLNAAWMSRVPEKQGQLVYPINQFEELLGQKAYFHLALVHHPFNWYQQGAYHGLRRRLRQSCTAVLSGHEHVGNAGKITEEMSGASLFFEAPALNPETSSENPGFCVHSFDLDKHDVVTRTFDVLPQGARDRGEVFTQSWSDDALIHGALDTTGKFSTLLNDAGGNFTHTAKERIFLEDIFVWPDVCGFDRDDVGQQRVRSAINLANSLESGDRFIVYGDDKSGKTTLLRSYFKELASRGFAPLLISASETSIKSSEDASKVVKQLTREQYRNPDSVAGFAIERRILLIDDIDRLRSGVRSLKYLLDYASRHFSGICFTASTDFEIASLASKEELYLLTSIEGHELMRFGLKLRHKLIKKWCSLAAIDSKIDLDRRVDEVESIVNSVVGKRLVPEHPLYLLILLQSCEQHRHGEIQNSGLSFYYQYLITKSLGEVGVKPVELDEYFNYLSLLAWRYRQREVKELSRVELSRLNREFSDRFVSVDLEERLALFVRARILLKRGDCYSFSYPYVYYFFIGRYLAKNIDNPDIRGWVESSCKKLHLRDRAHSIMFLTHHVDNRWVIDLISSVLSQCFSDRKPLQLDEDTSNLSALVEKSAQLSLPSPNVDRNQEQVRELADNAIDDEQEEDVESYDLLSFSSKWNLLHKTAEILGHILKNYYGSLERKEKSKMIVEVLNGPLRALRIWVDEMANELPTIVQGLAEEELKGKPNLSPEVADKRVKRRLFRIMGMVATGVVSSAASFVNSDKLGEDLAAAVSANPTNSYRLIEAASRLLRPGTVPVDSLKRLARDLEQNPYAFGVLQNLGFFHMYMYHTEQRQKQAICEALKISLGAAQAIEVRRVGRTLN